MIKEQPQPVKDIFLAIRILFVSSSFACCPSLRLQVCIFFLLFLPLKLERPTWQRVACVVQPISGYRAAEASVVKRSLKLFKFRTQFNFLLISRKTQDLNSLQPPPLTLLLYNPSQLALGLFFIFISPVGGAHPICQVNVIGVIELIGIFTKYTFTVPFVDFFWEGLAVRGDGIVGQ